MKTALELELEAVQLADRLDSGNPYLNRLYFLHFFSPMLEDDPTRWLSYRRQFISYLPHLCSGLNQCGWDPVDLERLLDIVRAFHGCCAEQETLVFDAEQQLRTACALHYLHVGEPERAAAVLGWPPPAEIGADVYDRLLSIAPAEQSRDDLLAAAAAMRAALNAFRVGSLKVVLLAGQGEQTVGVLLPLHAQAKERPADAEEDRVLLNNTVPLQHGSLLWSLYDALAAARAAMSEPVAASYYSYQFSVADKEAELIGPSMSLAAAVCAWAAAGNRYYRLARYLFNQNAVVTGTIDADGCVKSVDEKGLAAKLRTVFFSPVERIFVPQDNLPFALRYLGELQKRYPKRQLSVQGIGTLEQALRDRNLVQTRPLTPTLRLISHTRRLKRKGLKSAVLAAFVFLLLLLSLDPFGWRQDRRPATFDVLNSEFIVKNAAGEILWKYDFGVQLNRRKYTEIQQYYPTVLFDDIDDDGKIEVIMGTDEISHESIDGRVFCFAHNGRLRWIAKPHHAVRFGRYDYQDRFYIAKIIVIKTRKGKRLAVTAIHRPFFPSPLTILTPAGEQVGQFWHAGHAHELIAYDFDKDGDEEIFYGGCR
ncbi:MAG: hypothetical protein ONB24_12275, partial [candidate division KSB1 bacterium]|nr:hypothetical protein [candidate division KSB1 bacterium]